MSAVSSSKYQPLTAHLRSQRASRVPMSFAEIERVVGTKLPPSAGSHRAWWSNNPTNNVMTRAWLEAGFQSEQVDLDGRRLVFRRVVTGAPSVGSEDSLHCEGAASSRKLGLFGWLRGTVVSTGDLMEPADPDWARRIERE